MSTKGEEAITWCYKDPYGNEHGSFSSKQMHDWFTAGYFTPSVLVKKAGEENFKPISLFCLMNGSKTPFRAPTRHPHPKAETDGRIVVIQQAIRQMQENSERIERGNKLLEREIEEAAAVLSSKKAMSNIARQEKECDRPKTMASNKKGNKLELSESYTISFPSLYRPPPKNPFE
ncbi:hypothetical protein QR680_002787 [Steinernema hermaphroditum]|uniref:GYF domain-containing protein n=1 Tax=Steinernema hermaphroditum TaxID=289476 RepID=A0AA39LIT2_9BILA|nr:hypothetical protein QR680_002787 [Steinernema hermaphroditum]